MNGLALFYLMVTVAASAAAGYYRNEARRVARQLAESEEWGRAQAEREQALERGLQEAVAYLGCVEATKVEAVCALQNAVELLDQLERRNQELLRQLERAQGLMRIYLVVSLGRGGRGIGGKMVWKN